MCVFIHSIPLVVLPGGCHYHPRLTEGTAVRKLSTLPQTALLVCSGARVAQSLACIALGDVARASEYQGTHLSSVQTEHREGQICWSLESIPWLGGAGWEGSASPVSELFVQGLVGQPSNNVERGSSQAGEVMLCDLQRSLNSEFP